MSHQLDSPYKNTVSPKDTTPQTPTAGGTMGHDKILATPVETGDFHTVFFPDIPASTGTYDSPFDMALAKSVKDVSGGAPTGNSVMESTFKDALAKGKS